LARSPRVRAAGRRLLRVAGVLAVVAAGSGVGTALAPAVPAQVGPLRLEVRVVPSIHPGVQLLLPPAGEVRFDTHAAPLAVEAGVSEVDLEGARSLILSPTGLRALQDEAPDELRVATLKAGALSAGLAFSCSLALALLVYRTNWRRTRQVSLAMAGVLGLTAATAGLTFNSDRFAQPHFEGLLSQAPYVASQTSGLVQRLESYRSGLADIVQSVTTLYGAGDDLPGSPGSTGEDVVTVLHVSDMHLNPLGFDLTERLVNQFAADVVVDTGDITTWGTEAESALLARIRDVKVPYVFVRGNHDSPRTQLAVAANPNAVVLDGRAVEVAGLVFAGIGDPRFTPDGAVSLSRTTGATTDPATPTTLPTIPPTPPSGSASATLNSPVPSTATQAVVPGEDPELVEGRHLARIVREWNIANPGHPVAAAAFHEPAGAEALDGVVPLVLSGHLHHRSVKHLPDGTRVMIQGSTGGAGFDGLRASAGDKEVPLTATVLYFARTGERAGQLLAYDEVTVGGFGLASVSLERTVVRPDGKDELVPGELRGAEACASSSSGVSTDPRCVTSGTSSESRSIRPAPPDGN
jgi:predicted MPP superfamily phosphohydrolase